MNVQSMFLDGEILGSYLAKVFSLNRQYFLVAYKKKCNINVQLRELNGYVFVKVPNDVRRLIDEGYIARKIEQDDDGIEYEHRFELSKDCVIGFWK
jgi:hypothetical protein